jgi:hypothetical protein
VEDDCGTGSGGGLAEGDVGDGSRAGEDADAHVLAAAEAGNGLDDVVSAGNLENVGAHGGLRVAGDEDRRLGLVLGSRWAAPRPPNHLDGGSISAFRGEFGLLGLARRRGGVSGSTTASAAVLIFRGLLLAFTWCGGGGDLVEGMRKWVVELLVLVLVVLMMLRMLVLVVKLGKHAESFTLWLYIFTFHVGNFPLFIPLCILFVTFSSLCDWLNLWVCNKIRQKQVEIVALVAERDGLRVCEREREKTKKVNGTKRYVYFPGKPRWYRPMPMTLTYGFSSVNFISSLSSSDIKVVFKRAFATWASVIPVSFADIKLIKKKQGRLRSWGWLGHPRPAGLGVAEPPPWPKGWPANPNGVVGHPCYLLLLFFFFF